MRAFVTVVEEGGLSAAARRLHISQPALSQTMNALERELGVRLLVRSTTGVEATDAGMTLLGEARGVLARHDQALAAMAVHTAPGAATLRLGIPLELPSDLLSEALADLAEAYPATRVQARTRLHAGAPRLVPATAGHGHVAPLVGHPLVRRTWAVWDAGSHRRDLGHLLTALDFRGPN